MRALALILLAGCGFEVSGATTAVDASSTSDGTTDAPVDAPPPPPFCPQDPTLRLCFSFDQPMLGPALANEGSAAVDAEVTNVARIASPSGGAAQFGPTSSIWLPMDADVSSILSIEMSFRADAWPGPDGARTGLLDSNVSPPNISLFVYEGAGGQQVRCGLGSQLLSVPATLAIGAWHQVTCVCDQGTMRITIDGTNAGEGTGGCATGGSLVSAGLAIGSDNSGGNTSFPDRLVGAIDGVRLWAKAIAP